MHIAIAVSRTILTDVAVLDLVIRPYPRFETSKDDELLGSHIGDKVAKFLIEYVDFFWVGHGRSIGTFDGYSDRLFTWENLHLHKKIIDSFWNANKPLTRLDLTAKQRRSLIPFGMLTSSFTRLDLTAKPTSASHLSLLLRSLQKKV